MAIIRQGGCRQCFADTLGTCGRSFSIRYVLPSRNVAVLAVKLDNKRFARDVVLNL